MLLTFRLATILARDGEASCSARGNEVGIGDAAWNLSQRTYF